MISENSQMFICTCKSLRQNQAKGEGRHHNDFSCYPLWNRFSHLHTPSLSCSAAMDHSWPCKGMDVEFRGAGHSHRRKTRWWARKSSWLSPSLLEFHCVGSNSVTRPKSLALCHYVESRDIIKLGCLFWGLGEWWQSLIVPQVCWF